MLILGLLMCCFAFIVIIRGRIPFVEQYHGVKNITLHSRIEGTAVLLCGIMIIISHFVGIDSVIMMAMTVLICVVTLVLEIVFKVF